MADAIVKWEVVRGIGERMTSEFLTSVFFSEGELSLDGIVRQFIDGRQDVGEQATQAFAGECGEDYRNFVAELTGDERIGANSKSAVLAYVDSRGLHGEYDAFVSEYKSRWGKGKDRDEEFGNLVDSVVTPLFEQLQKNSIYIFRDSDHWGVHFMRTQE